MNERIRELLKQAAKFANTNDNKDFDRNFDMIVAEKFAQLIVRECMKQVWYDREAIVTDRISESIKERICQHFGVEE